MQTEVLFFYFISILSTLIIQTASQAVPPSDPVIGNIPPQEVGRGERTKRCPPEFEEIGKECIRVIRVASSLQCAAGGSLTPEKTCATYSGKTATCQSGFTRNGNRCHRQQAAQPSLYCAPGYTLTDQNECTGQVPATPQEVCEGGSIRRGDLCIIEADEQPELTCPPGSVIDGKKCVISELYNCTPPRQDGVSTPTSPFSQASTPTSPFAMQPTPPFSQGAPPAQAPPMPPLIQTEAVSPVVVHTYQQVTSVPAMQTVTTNPNKLMKLVGNVSQGQGVVVPEGYRLSSPAARSYAPRAPQPSWRRAQALPAIPGSKGFVPELTEYVVQATCRRIRTIPAQKLCARGYLNGKMCRVEIEITPTVANPYAFETDVQLPQQQCPDGFTLTSANSCGLEELANLLYVCGDGLQDIGDRCALYSPPSVVCPPGFATENDSSCIATLRAPPITEFTVRYACMGKDCAQR